MERFILSLPKRQHDWLRRESERLGVSMAEILRRVLDQMIPNA